MTGRSLVVSRYEHGGIGRDFVENRSCYSTKCCTYLLWHAIAMLLNGHVFLMSRTKRPSTIPSSEASPPHAWRRS